MQKKLLIILLACISFSVINAQTILGVDVSSYEGTINWSQVKAGGYTFAFAKATEGVGLTDSYFVGNETNGTAAGVVMGAYHFGHPENNTATAEANYFLSVAGPYIKTCYLPPVLDLEDPPSGPSLSTYFTPAQLTAWVQTWMTTVKNATGIAPIIYIGPSNASFVDSSLNVYGLWIDDYNSNPKNPPPNIGVWKTWDFKQYSWTGTIPGISGTNNVDQDVFHGSINQFNTLIGCNAVLAGFTSNVKSVCPGSSVNFTDQSTTTGTLSGWQWTFAGGTPSTSTSQNPTITYNTPGVYSVKEVVTSSVGKDSVTYSTYINVLATGTLPLIEDFQSSTFPPTGWYLNLPSANDSMWELCTSKGYSSTHCMYFPANCGQTVNIAGQRQQIYTPVYSFATAKNAEMSFDVAYEPSNLTSTPKYSDTLVVYYSTDCGNTWTSIYSKGGATLSTTGSTTGAGTDTAGSHGHGCFEPPSNSAWRRDSVSLVSLYGQSSVMFSFESRSGWGNIVYLDNINVTAPGLTSIPTITNNNDVRIYPNPSSGVFNLIVSNYESTMDYTISIYNLLGQQVYSASLNALPQITQGFAIDLGNKTNGMYFYRIANATRDKIVAEGKLVLQK
jgi:GH25 family lysozyme M1 (1,4-beta-N-acetylmuramidase)